jgi:hypothetical protein
MERAMIVKILAAIVTTVLVVLHWIYRRDPEKSKWIGWAETIWIMLLTIPYLYLTY